MSLKNVSMPKADVALKNYFEDDEIFASVFNSVLFNKSGYIDPKSLKKDNTEYTISVTENGRIRKNKKISRYRDIIRRSEAGCLVILGIENQDKIHYAMPIRKLLYDALEYVSQITELKADTDEMREWTVDERLSGVKKGTKLLPVITVVFYTGEEEWDGPKSLYDMLDADDVIRNILPDQPLYVIDLGHDENLTFTNEDLEELRLIVSDIYARRLDRDTLVDTKNLAMAGILVGDKGLYAHAQKKEGKREMCKVLQERDAELFAELFAEKDAEIKAARSECKALKERDAELFAEKDAEIEKLKALLKKNNITVEG